VLIHTDSFLFISSGSTGLPSAFSPPASCPANRRRPSLPDRHLSPFTFLYYQPLPSPVPTRLISLYGNTATTSPPSAAPSPRGSPRGEAATHPLTPSRTSSVGRGRTKTAGATDRELRERERRAQALAIGAGEGQVEGLGLRFDEKA
jgi:hypothetical protein